MIYKYYQNVTTEFYSFPQPSRWFYNISEGHVCILFSCFIFIMLIIITIFSFIQERLIFRRILCNTYNCYIHDDSRLFPGPRRGPFQVRQRKALASQGEAGNGRLRGNQPIRVRRFGRTLQATIRQLIEKLDGNKFD